MRLVVCLALALSLITPSPHASLAAQEPGAVLLEERMPDAPAGVTAWRIRYVTGGRGGVARQEASAVIMAPTYATGRQPRGVVAWTHGTWGVASKCAPSKGAQFFDVTPAVSAVAMGYVVVAPDYPGLGVDNAHPYLIAQTREDPLVSPQVTRAFARKACLAGLRIKWVDLPGKDHATTASQSAFETLQWIEDRFGGAPAPNDCAVLR